MPTTPNWSTAKASTTSDLGATNYSAQVNQNLGTHNITPIYVGTPIVSPTGTDLAFSWLSASNTVDVAQPFTMPAAKTSIARIQLPLNVVGAGGDLRVSLCPTSAGVPDTSNVLSSTMIPRELLSAYFAPFGVSSAGPLAQSPRYNSMYPESYTILNWPNPAGTPTGSLIYLAGCNSGSYIILAGGYDTTTTNLTTLVTAAQHIGGGVMAPPQTKVPLPVATGRGTLTVTDNCLIYAGGQVNPSLTVTTNTWVASWEPSSGTIGSWSAQTALPSALYGAVGASYNNRIYLVGGFDASSNFLNTVYSADVSSGQINSWRAETPYPLAINQCWAQAINGWLVVAGGQTTGSVYHVETYYAKISSTDGSLGPWLRGPDLPLAVADITGNTYDHTAQADSTFLLFGGEIGGPGQVPFMSLTVTPEGVADSWVYTYSPHFANIPSGVFSNGDGTWWFTGIGIQISKSIAILLTPALTMSIPLPASGLTAGATYHVVLSQTTGSGSGDYLQFGTNAGSEPANLLTSTRHSSSWSAGSTSIPLTVYDNVSVSGSPIHTWEDPTSTGSGYTSNQASVTRYLNYNGNKQLTDLSEITSFSANALNANPTFTSGVSSWTAHNCTFTQSNAQTHGGFAFSGLMTPNGVSGTASVTSELIPITATDPLYSNAQWFNPNGWFYSPTGYPSVSVSVDWYDKNSAFLGTVSTIVTLAAATWTNLAPFYQAPAGTCFAAININETGVPAAGNTLYFSNVTFMLAPESANVFSSAVQVNYSAAGTWPPNGTTQLI